MTRVLLRRLTLVAIAVLVVSVGALTAFRVAAGVHERKPRRTAAPRGGYFVRAADVELYVQEAGPSDGVPVVLIHGTGAWSEIWRETMTALASAGFRAIAVDMPPFGFSQRPDPPRYDDASQARRILGALDAMHLTRVVLVGHSFGARPTVEVALRAPSQVRALVLVDAALDLHIPPAESLSTSPAVTMLLAPSPIRNGLVAATLTNPLFTKRLLELLIATPAAATPARVHMLQQPFVVTGTTDAFGRWLVPFATTRERSLSTDPARVRTLTMPTLVMWGEKDTVTPLALGREIAHLLPNADLLVLPRVGHIPAIEDPQLFNSLLIGYLSRGQTAMR